MPRTAEPVAEGQVALALAAVTHRHLRMNQRPRLPQHSKRPHRKHRNRRLHRRYRASACEAHPHHHSRKRKDCHIVSFSNQAPPGDIQPMIGLGLSFNIGVVVKPTAIFLALMSKFFLGMKIRME